MTKELFLNKLRDSLNELPTEERENCVRFYEDYITDADDDVEAVLKELGSPEKLAAEVVKEYYLNTDVTKNKKPPLTKEFSEIHTVICKLKNSAITVERGEKYTLTIPENNENDYSEIIYSTENGVLNIEEKTKKNHRFSIQRFFAAGFSSSTYKNNRIKITLPNTMYNEFSLSTVNGGVSISDVSVKSLLGETVNGGIKLSSVKAEKIKVSAVNGSVKASNIESETFTCSHINGSTHIDGSLCGVLDLDCVNGSINVDTSLSENQCDLNLRSHSGGVYINGEKYKGSVKKLLGNKTVIKCSTVNGSVRVKTASVN